MAAEVGSTAGRGTSLAACFLTLSLLKTVCYLDASWLNPLFFGLDFFILLLVGQQANLEGLFEEKQQLIYPPSHRDLQLLP